MSIINSLQDKIDLIISKKDIEYKIELVKDINLVFKEENKLEDIIIYEDKFYDFKIQTYKHWDSMHIIVGNEEVKSIINYDNSTQVEIKELNIFKCMYSWNNIVIALKKEENIEFYKSKYFTIATAKVSKEFICEMIEDIYNFDSELLEEAFVNNTKIDKCKNKRANLTSFIQFVEKVQNAFSNNYNIFRMNPKSRIVKKMQVVNIHKACRVDAMGFQWILRNPDCLEKIGQETGITYGNQNYIPKKILSEEKNISFDCYENKVILGFLSKLRTDVSEVYTKIKNLTSKNIFKNREIEEGYINVSDIIGKLLEKKNKEFEDQILEVKRRLDKVYNAYKNLFRCKESNIKIKPQFTDTFRSIKHYRDSFVLINEYLEYKQFDFTGYSYVYMLITLDNIYEYYCLIKLIKVYKALGYVMVSKENPYGKEVEKLFTLTKGKEKIVIFYQPIISSCENSRMPLCRRSNGIYYKPDYIVMYQNNGKELFSIYDAKFSFIENVKKYYIENLCYKYIIDIYKKGRRNNFIINLAAFSVKGKELKKCWCIDKCKREVLPQIDIISMSSYNTKEDILHYFNSINTLARNICDIYDKYNY